MTVLLCKVCFERSWHFAVWKNFLHNSAQSPDLNHPTGHLWDELDWWLWATSITQCQFLTSLYAFLTIYIICITRLLCILMLPDRVFICQSYGQICQSRIENRVFYGEYLAVLHGVWQLIFNLKIYFLKINTYCTFLCCNKTQFTRGFVCYGLPRVVWT